MNKNQINYKSSGIVKYCQNTRWVMLDTCEDLTKYYRHLYYLYRHKCEKIYPCVWPSHCTIINGKYDHVIENLWNKHLDREIEFTYNPHPIVGDEYIWLEIESLELEQIRLECGLTKFPLYKFHISVAVKNRI